MIVRIEVTWATFNELKRRLREQGHGEGPFHYDAQGEIDSIFLGDIELTKEHDAQSTHKTSEIS